MFMMLFASSLFNIAKANTNFRKSPILFLLNVRKSSHVCKKLIFEEFGDPIKVIKLHEETLPSVKSSEVVVKFLISPVNPADINVIQGVYPVKPSLPGTPGFEGVGEIVEVGSDVKDLEVGDRVIPNSPSIGTWRTCGIIDPEYLLKVPKDVNLVGISGIISNPCTAYRMLTDYVKLESGDTIIQNAANSACGQNVIQLCRIRNITSINIVRNRPEIDKLKSYLTSLGANYVLTEEELRSTSIFKSNECKKPKLALNAVSGRSATEILRQLEDKGTMVTYGGMSKEPVTIPVSSFIFKDLSCRGFWNTRWIKENKNSTERKRMIDELAHLMRTGELKAPAHKLIPISEYAEALMNTVSGQGFSGHKYFFDFTSG